MEQPEKGSLYGSWTGEVGPFHTSVSDIRVSMQLAHSVEQCIKSSFN